MKTPTIMLCLFLQLAALTGQELEVPVSEDEEAPTAIFQTEIGSTDVDLYISGSWKASLVGMTGVGFSEYSFNFPAAYPDMVPGFQFLQTPDLTISLWLYESWFFQTSVKGGFDENTFLIGYAGDEDDFFRSAKIGNGPVEVASYAYMDTPVNDDKSPAAGFILQNKRARHDFFLKYDPVETRKKTFRGQKELTITELQLHDYISDRFFVLPDSGITNFILFTESADGTITASDGRKYRQASPADYRIDTATGFLELAESPPGRVLIYYTANGQDIGSPLLGGRALPAVSQGYYDPGGTPVDFNWGMGSYNGRDILERQVTIQSYTGLVLHEPGELSPFGRYNTYAPDIDIAGDSAEISIYLSPQGAEGTENTTFSTEPENNTITAYTAGAEPRSMENRFVFSEYAA